MHLWFRYEPEKRKITIFAAKILIPYIISVEGRRGAKNKFNPQIDIRDVDWRSCWAPQRDSVL